MNRVTQIRRSGAAAIAGLALVTGAGFLLSTSAPAWGSWCVLQEGELPSASEIVDKYIEATGGREAYEALESQRATGTVEIAEMGLKGTVEVYQQAPDKMLVVMNLPGRGEIRRGVNGDVGWMSDPTYGVRLLTEPEMKDALRDADPNTILNIEENYESVEVKGVEDVKGEQAYHLVFTPKDEGNPTDHYYSVESGLLIKTAQTQSSPLGDVRSEAFLSDYKEVGDNGLKQPHTNTAVAMGVEQVMTIEEVEINGEIAADRFAIPDDVKALVEKEKAAE